MANDILITTETLKSILPVFEDNIIEKVKDASPKIVEPANDDIPMIFIPGTIPDSKTYVSGELEYVSKSSRFHAYTYIKLQGSVSLLYPKKNFTINLYSDESRSNVLNKEFKNWGIHNNFVLKADYTDILHARNVVGAKLWSKVVQSRSDYNTLPEELRNSPNNGAIDGFPVRVYINGAYQGLYNWTIPKCDWMVGMNSTNLNHVLLSSEFNDNGDVNYQYNPCNFNTLWDGNKKYFDVEVGKNSAELVSSLNTIISAIINNDSASLEQALDIKSAIDYFIFQEIILGIDGLAKNMLLATYDMTKWYLSAYDMDLTFDLGGTGQILDCYNAYMGNYPYINQYSSLLQYIWDNYWGQYVERYVELRKSVLSHSSIIEEFEKYISIFGEDLYIQDTIPYPDIHSVTTNTLKGIRNFVRNRLEYLDDKYGVVI